LSRADLTPLLSPVMQIRSLSAPNAPPVSPDDAAGLIFTSVNGLLNFPQNWIAGFLDHPVFVSGSATLKLARNLGFQNVTSSPDHGSRGMLGLIRGSLTASDSAAPMKLLYIAGTSRTPILETELSPDYHLVLAELYAAELITQLSQNARQAFAEDRVVAATFFSRRTAGQAATVLRTQFGAQAAPVFERLLTVCISQAVADQARQAGFRRVAVASSESSDSVVNKLVEQLKIHSISSKTD
jgi:uroporphyrinogen-III synthase